MVTLRLLGAELCWRAPVYGAQVPERQMLFQAVAHSGPVHVRVLGQGTSPPVHRTPKPASAQGAVPGCCWCDVSNTRQLRVLETNLWRQDFAA